MGPPFSGLTEELDPIPQPPVRLDDDAVSYREFVEATNFALIAYIVRESVGDASLWADQVVTTIAIGGGASHTSTLIGRAGQTVRLAGTLDVQDDAITPAVPYLVSSAVDLELSAHGTGTNLNEVGDTNLNVPYYSSAGLSVVAAINEGLNKPVRFTASELLNGSGGVLSLGTLVQISATGTVGLATAAADDADSELVGSAAASTPVGVLGKIAYEGEIPVKFTAGEGVGVHAKKPVFLSAVAGFGTLTAPVGNGEVELLVGYVVDDSAYADGSGGTMLVSTARAQRRVLS